MSIFYIFLIDNNGDINFVFADDCTHPVGGCFLYEGWITLKIGVPTSEWCVDHDDDNPQTRYLQVPQ